MSKKRKVYPTLRPPVENGPIQGEAEAWAIADVVIADTAEPPITDERATEAARRYRCPSHGRSTRATAAWAGGWLLNGVCCDRAAVAIAASLNG
jgi:hypothetical protein